MTAPGHPFIGRQTAAAAVEQTMAVAGPLLQECVDIGGQLFLDTQPGAQAMAPDVAIAPLRLFHKVLECTDAAELLLSAGTVRAAAAPVRSAFEATAELMLMHRLGDRFDSGSLTWLASKLARRRSFLSRALKLEPDDEPFVLEMNERIGDMEAVLERLAGMGVKSEKPWYRNFGSGKPLANLEDLVALLDAGTDPKGSDRTFRRGYALLYTRYADTSHASDHDAFYELRDGRMLLRPIRQPAAVGELAANAVGFFLGAAHVIAERFRPDLVAGLNAWYANSIKERYLFLVEDDEEAPPGPEIQSAG